MVKDRGNLRFSSLNLFHKLLNGPAQVVDSPFVTGFCLYNGGFTAALICLLFVP